MSILFFSYSHKDEALRDRLEVSLKTMQRQGLIDVWHDRRIDAGDDFGGRIKEEMERADVILLLVSPDFIASDYCYDVEMTRAMERHEAGEARVIPVILRPCDWHPAPFGKLLAAPKDGKAITTWPDSDTAFLDVSHAIRNALKSFGATPSPKPRLVADDVRPSSTPRSSNLSVRKTFTDADRDSFLDEAFEFVARFFEASLGELKDRNEGIEFAFRRIDANRFTSVVYRGGKAISKCTVGRGGLYDQGITYSMDDKGDTNSMNEALSVESDDHGLFLKPLGMAMRGNQQDQHLTFEGGAEYYWAILMEPLQRRR